jgi:hypothetical protein
MIGRDSASKPIAKRPEVASKLEENPNAAAGILLEECQAVVVSGNLFSGLSTVGVEQTAGCSSIVLHGNLEVETRIDRQ